MIGCVLTGHGNFATGLADAIGMIAGEQDEFYPVAFLEAAAGEYPDELRNAINTALDKSGAVLVMCDFVGGTPFNQAMLATAATSNAEVVAGANLPMLLEVLSQREPHTSLSELVELAVQAGRVGVDHVVLEAATDEPQDDDFGI